MGTAILGGGQLQDQAGHPVDARIPRGDEGDSLPSFGPLKAIRHRSTSRVIPVAIRSFPAVRSRIRSR